MAPSKCRRRWLDAGIDAAGAAAAARRELVFRVHSVAGETAQPHRFPAQLCEQDFDAYEEAVITDESMNRVASLLDNESPRAPDPRR